MVASSNGWLPQIPALFTSRSILPKCSMVVAIRSLPPSGVETSLPFAIASPPRVRMRSATCSAIVESFPNPDTSVPRSFTTTRAPRSARSSTYARPSPRPAPVTTATFPSNEIRSVTSRPSFDESSRSPVQGHWPATCSHDADAHQASSELRLTVTAAPGSWGGCDRGSWLLGRPASEPGTLFQDDRAQGRGHRRRRTFILPILQTLSQGPLVLLANGRRANLRLWTTASASVASNTPVTLDDPG